MDKKLGIEISSDHDKQVESGRRLAMTLVEASISSIRSGEQAYNLMHTFHHTAIYLLALEHLNLRNNEGLNLKDYMKNVVEGLNIEIRFLDDPNSGNTIEVEFPMEKFDA